MKILGFSGGPNAVHEHTFEVFPGGMHDAAAVLLEDGEVVAAIEQERLDRIKHSNKRPFDAIRFCLDTAGIGLGEVDELVFYGERDYWDRMLADHFLHHQEQTHFADARTLLAQLLESEIGGPVRDGQPRFVGHHLAHAMSAVALAGFDESLTLVIDAQGDDISGLVLRSRGTDLEVLRRLELEKSLGYFYLAVIEYLGFHLFDEYKVMGLAPYGDPSRFRAVLQSMYTLLPEGDFALHPEARQRLFEVSLPRRAEAAIESIHQDLAAALQEALETIVFHVLRHFRAATGLRHLCLAGGVAHNCTLNGKILYSGLFDQVFVQPAAHDAGCALGAALYVHHLEGGPRRARCLTHLYWGSPIGSTAEVAACLRPWEGLVEVERLHDPAATAAELLAAGDVLGWAQGRSEFGPRALGNRSIVADPRPASNKELINAMVKKREAFRPFAPAVVEQRAAEFFELAPGVERLPFMVFTVRVRPEVRELLGATTHVDGTARIQTVGAATNEPFWRLLTRFGESTGLPILLNTSFNNNAEPIVDSVEDAVVCFLTTRLDALVVGDFLVRRRAAGWQDYLALVPSLPVSVELRRTRGFAPDGWREHCECLRNTRSRGCQLSAPLLQLLTQADGRRQLADLVPGAVTPHHGPEALVTELLALWSARLVRLRPAQA